MTDFFKQFYDELGKFDAFYDTAGAFTGSQDEFFRHLGKVAGQIQSGKVLTIEQASEFKPVLEQLARVSFKNLGACSR